MQELQNMSRLPVVSCYHSVDIVDTLPAVYGHTGLRNFLFYNKIKYCIIKTFLVETV